MLLCELRLLLISIANRVLPERSVNVCNLIFAVGNISYEVGEEQLKQVFSQVRFTIFFIALYIRIPHRRTFIPLLLPWCQVLEELQAHTDIVSIDVTSLIS